MRKLLRILDWETQQRLLEFRALLRSRFENHKHYDYSFDNVSKSSKHTNPASLIDRLLRYEACLGEKIPFQGRTVLGIGAGPLLGWAFVALALGAKRYYVLEPGLDSELPLKFGNYFEQHRRFVNRTLGTVDELENLIAEQRIQIIAGEAHNTGLPEGSVDLILSNSVLEHINNLPEVAQEFYRISSEQGVQYHFVDLKDHGGGKDPFAQLYPFDLDHLRQLFARRGMKINGLRPSDMRNVFSSLFDVNQSVFFEDSSHPSIRNAHPYWKDRYDEEDLGIEVMALKVLS